MITENDVKERFIARTFTQYKTVKKAFVEWKGAGSHYLEFDHFRRLMDDWGFNAKPEQVDDLLTWLDADGDGRISYEDLRHTVGKEIAPMEQIYFRQDNRGTKQQSCNYPECWENTMFNKGSSYCQLHQKIMRNQVLDHFNQVATSMSRQDWDNFAADIINKKYFISIKDLNTLLVESGQKPLTAKLKEYLFESYKAKRNAEDNPDDINERFINAKDIISTRLMKKNKKIDDLIAIQREQDN